MMDDEEAFNSSELLELISGLRLKENEYEDGDMTEYRKGSDCLCKLPVDFFLYLVCI